MSNPISKVENRISHILLSGLIKPNLDRPTVAKWWGFFFLTSDSCSYIHGIIKKGNIMNKPQLELNEATVQTIGQLSEAIKVIANSINTLQKAIILLKERVDKLDERSSS